MLFCHGKRQYEIIRFNVLGHQGDRLWRERKCIVSTSRNRKVIKQLIDGNSRVFIKQIALETSINFKEVRQMTKRNLGQTVEAPKCSAAHRWEQASNRRSQWLCMRSWLRLNKRTITKTTDAVLHKLSVVQPPYNTANIRRPSWCQKVKINQEHLEGVVLSWTR